MNRKNFIKRGLIGFGSIVALPTVIGACSDDESSTSDIVTGECELSPSETAGPFPIKTPTELVKENIIVDRLGVALLINVTVVAQSNDCTPLAGVLVDIWHCDADGNYSEYSTSAGAHFLRGRQTADANGKVSFTSIYPGWYRGRAPHIHVEVLDSNENSLRVTQIAFSESISETVYASDGYNGTADTANATDNVFSNSLDGNMADTITGNVTDGYTLLKTIVV